MTADLPGVRRLVEVVATLRSENGCPWDREQSLNSLKPYLIEEAYELLDAVDSGDRTHHREELGDVLLQVALQAQIRAEEGAFTFDDVAMTLAEKLVRRHPHVFGDVTVRDSHDVLKNWETIKAEEKQTPTHRSIADGLPRHLPGLQRAQRVQSRAAKVGFDWDHIDGAVAKLDEELAELREALRGSDAAAVRDEIGDMLFSVVNVCRFCGVNAEEAVDRAVRKFLGRFARVEACVHAEGRKLSDCTLEELDGFWNAAKNADGQACPLPTNPS